MNYENDPHIYILTTMPMETERASARTFPLNYDVNVLQNKCCSEWLKTAQGTR